ncbi:enoyl-CoA hydratase/isomerase family protein [Nonomuraea sp. NPDC046570]|uniref:enoyl-CoA hydratase/isomerase family protein n=1 Tax=Nonomuraea sp. NPDC046570 TaxID=3155255 RepID=UPI0033CF74BA
MYKKLLVKRDGPLLTVSLNRPEKLNAIGGELATELIQVFDEIKADATIGAVLLCAEGRAFCAGGDVDSFAAGSDLSPAQQAIALREDPIVSRLTALEQPVVAAVNGYAMGLGATLALFCDVVVAAEDAQFADTHVAMGLVAGDGGAVMWPLLMSFGAARYYLMTGERISGAEAARIGMILRAVPAGQLRDEATKVARKLAGLPPLAVRGTKATLDRIVKHRADLVMETGLLLEGATFLSEDHAEAVSAFAEKRRPEFKGR